MFKEIERMSVTADFLEEILLFGMVMGIENVIKESSELTDEEKTVYMKLTYYQEKKFIT